jgi:hypothetical protein
MVAVFVLQTYEEELIGQVGAKPWPSIPAPLQGAVRHI